MDNGYTLRGFFTRQDKDTIEKMKKAINFTTRANTTEDDLDILIDIFWECNALLRVNARNYEGSEQWYIDYFSCFWTFASVEGDWCSDDIGWVISDACDLLRGSYGYK